MPRTPLTAVTPTDKPRNPRRHDEFMERITQGNIGLLFLGDSITDGWPRHGELSWLKLLPTSQPISALAANALKMFSGVLLMES